MATELVVPTAPKTLPVIDVSALVDKNSTYEQRLVTGKKIGDACRDFGFFYVSNHGVDKELLEGLFTLGKKFFQLPVSMKNQIHMKDNEHYRGYFMLGEELTSKKQDVKEGLYFGKELAQDAPEVKEKLPLHGPNLFPDEKLVPGLKHCVLKYMDVLEELGHNLMQGIGISLGLGENFFREKFTTTPHTPFRLFYYPSDPNGAAESRFGVGKHTDYGVLTILAQDEVGGLEVETKYGWIAAPPIPDTFVVNIGDCLEAWTNGYYKATPHRVLNRSTVDRMSAPFFFDPHFHCMVEPLTQFLAPGKEAHPTFHYGNHIVTKVENNFKDMKAGLSKSMYSVSENNNNKSSKL